jgi:hypothetical protein
MEEADARNNEQEKATELSEEEKAYLNAVTGILNRLSIACKSRSLYPADHPTALEAVSILHSVLSDSLSYIPKIVVRAGKDCLIFGDWKIGEKRESMRQLASRIRSLKIKEITFVEDLTQSEVETLVELLIYDPEELELVGGAEAFLLTKGTENIGVIESMAQLAEGETGIEGGFEADATEDEGKGFAPTIGKGSKLIAGATITQTKADKEPLDIDVSNEDKDFLELLLDPESLAQLLQDLGREKDPSSDIEKLADAVFDYLKDASQRVEFIYPGLAQSCFRSMAEALLFLETDLRNTVMLRHLIPKVKVEPICESILGSLNETEMSDILCYFFPAALELVPKTRKLLSAIGFKEEEGERIIDLIRNRLIELGEVPPSVIATLEKGVDSDGTLRVAAHELPAPDLLSAFFNEYRPEELEEIKHISELDLKTQTLLDTVPVLLDMMEQGTKLDNMDRVMELLEQEFWDVIGSARLDTAVSMLGRILSILEIDDTIIDPLRPELKRLAEEATSGKLINRLTHLAYEQREEPDIEEGFKRYISELGERGIVSLIEVLGTEEDMSCRKYMIDVLAELCENQVHILGTFVNDPRWFLVRNIVTIMAHLHNPDTLPYLRITLLHNNEKVRAETVRSLGLIGGYEACNILINNISNLDEKTRILCIRWLGRLEEGRAVGRLVNMLEDKEPGGESPLIKKEIIFSLGEIKDPETCEVLKKYCSRRKWFNRSEWHEVNDASRQALEQILEKFPHLRR